MNTNDQVFFRKHIRSKLNANLGLVEFNGVIQEAVRELGFSDFHLGALKKYQEIDFSVSSTPSEFAEFYTEFELHRYDMVVEYLNCNTEPIFQKKIEEYIAQAPYLTEHIVSNQEIQDLLYDYQIYDCLYLPIPNDRCDKESQKSKAFFVIYNRGEDYVDFQQRAKKYVSELIHMSNGFYSFALKQFPELFSN